MNAHAKRPRGELGPCPRCGLYSDQRLAIEGNPDMFLVACDACGWRTRKFTDINHAVRAWNEGRT
nr:MAG TPA: restriction alleviation protein [Caudoviricetes sp.]